MLNTSSSLDAIDVESTILPDDPSLPDAQTVATLDVKRQVAVFDPFKAAAAALVKLISDTHYDINTAAGEATARDFRSRCVKMRTGTADLYTKHNAPLLEVGKLMRAAVAGIGTDLGPSEKKLDEDIKGKEKARDEERLRKVAAEEARIKVLRERIAAISALPAQAVLLDSVGIHSIGLGLTDRIIDETSFEEFADEAKDLRAFVLTQLEALGCAASDREVAAERNRQEAIRLDEERLRLKAEAEDAIAAANQIVADAEALAAEKAYELTQQRQRDAEAEVERQRQADAQHTAQTAELKRKQDLFEAEKAEAARQQEEYAAALKADREEVAAQLRALAPKPELIPLLIADGVQEIESAGEDPTPEHIAAQFAQNVAIMDTIVANETTEAFDIAADIAVGVGRWDITILVGAVCKAFQESELDALTRLLSEETRAALLSRVAEIDNDLYQPGEKA